MSIELKNLKQSYNQLCEVANSDSVSLPNVEHRRLQNAIMLMHDNLNKLIKEWNDNKFPSEQSIDFLT